MAVADDQPGHPGEAEEKSRGAGAMGASSDERNAPGGRTAVNGRSAPSSKEKLLTATFSVKKVVEFENNIVYLHPGCESHLAIDFVDCQRDSANNKQA